MAITANQGYVRDLNLEETPDKTLTINNLGGGSISSDLSVFYANTKNSTKLLYKPNEEGFSVSVLGQSTLFTFDLLSCYGNGDVIYFKGARKIDNIVYDYQNDELTITFASPHELTNISIGSRMTIVDSYFDGPSPTFFNNKGFLIKSITSVNSLVLQDIGYSERFTNPPGNFAPSANLPPDQSTRYVYAVNEYLPLPSPLSYSQQYYVVLSNGTDRFQIATEYVRGQLVNPLLLSDPVDNPLVFERTNEVVQQNLINLIFPDSEFVATGEENFSFSNNIRNRSINDNFDYLESILDSSNFFKQTKYVRSINNVFSENPIKLEGNLTTIDPDNFNDGTAEIFGETSPGIFILDPNSSKENIIKLRSFSDNTSPWELNSSISTLEYSAASLGAGSDPTQQEMSIGNMILKGDPISVDNIQSVVVESAPNITPNQKFTHKLPVLINGEEYNLLLTDSAA